MSKALDLLSICEQATYEVVESEDGFDILAHLDGELAGKIMVIQEYVGSGGDGYPFEPYNKEPFYKDLIDHDFVINIQHLEVEDAAQGQGIATALMKQALEKIDTMYKGSPVYINASPIGAIKNLDRLIQFYEKFGFKLLKKFPEHSNALLWKEV